MKETNSLRKDSIYDMARHIDLSVKHVDFNLSLRKNYIYGERKISQWVYC